MVNESASSGDTRNLTEPIRTESAWRLNELVATADRLFYSWALLAYPPLHIYYYLPGASTKARVAGLFARLATFIQTILQQQRFSIWLNTYKLCVWLYDETRCKQVAVIYGGGGSWVDQQAVEFANLTKGSFFSDRPDRQSPGHCFLWFDKKCLNGVSR